MSSELKTRETKEHSKEWQANGEAKSCVEEVELRHEAYRVMTGSCMNMQCAYVWERASEWFSSINNSIPFRLPSPFLISPQLCIIYSAPNPPAVLLCRANQLVSPYLVNKQLDFHLEQHWTHMSFLWHLIFKPHYSTYFPVSVEMVRPNKPAWYLAALLALFSFPVPH